MSEFFGKIPMTSRAKHKWLELSDVHRGLLDMAFCGALLGHDFKLSVAMKWQLRVLDSYLSVLFLVEIKDATFVFVGRDDNDDAVLIDFYYSDEFFVKSVEYAAVANN